MNVDELMSGAFEGVKPQTDIALGERVRSYDFAGNFDCYAEGVVESTTERMEGCERYSIRVDRRVFGGKVVDAEATHVFPPLNGTPTMMGKVTNFVVRIESEPPKAQESAAQEGGAE